MRMLTLEELQKLCPEGIEIESSIDEGGYGTVYGLKGGKEVIKVLDPAYLRIKVKNNIEIPLNELQSLFLYKELVDQIDQELNYARRLTEIKNLNLLPITGLYRCEGVVEDIGRRTVFMLRMPRRKTIEQLGKQLKQDGKKPDEDWIIRIVCDLCRALETIHQDKVYIEDQYSDEEPFSVPGPLIHRDIKPDNVFIYDDPKNVRYYQLGDFGACFLSGRGWVPGQKVYSNEVYSAPETEQPQIGPASDVFSLGFMLYWWMNGWEHPVQARKLRSQADFEQNHKLANMSPEIWQVFMKATSQAPENRYATAAQLREALESAQKARNARIQEKEKKDAKKEGEKDGVLDTLIVEALIAAGVYAAKKVFGGGKSGKKVEDGQKQKALPTVQRGEKNFGNGLVYRGEIVDGKACGHGVLYCPDGGDLECIWNNNGIDHSKEGTFHFSNGSFLRGQWMLVNAEKDGYFGMMLDGECCGWGKQTYPTGGYYCGEFKNGFPDGRGSYTTKDGSCFTGDWDYFRKPEYKTRGLRLNGQFCGYVEMQYTFGSRHLGEFKDGAPCGDGVFIARDGTRMSGVWSYAPENKKDAYFGMVLNHKRNGIGTLKLGNGCMYMGEFRKGSITGWGQHLDQNGCILREGFWEDGRAAD